jgi:hypothetical protein
VSILTPGEVAVFLGVPENTPGLPEAIDQAESLVAGKLLLETLELRTYVEERVFRYRVQQILTKHGPLQELLTFEYNGKDYLSDVVVTPWNIMWKNTPKMIEDLIVNYGTRQTYTFPAGSSVSYSYVAGWTNSSGAYPLPRQVSIYAMSLTGILLNNLLMSGVYDTKLGDMTVKIQRETLEQNIKVYDNALRSHARPY